MKKPAPQSSRPDVLAEKRQLLAGMHRKVSVLTQIVEAATRKLNASAIDLDYVEGLRLVDRSTDEQVDRARKEHADVEAVLERETHELEATQKQVSQLETAMKEIEWEAAMEEVNQFQSAFDAAAKATIAAFDLAVREQYAMYLVLQAARNRFQSSEWFGIRAIPDTAGLPLGHFLPEFLPPIPGNRNRLDHLKNLIGRYKPELLPAGDPIRIEIERQREIDRAEQERSAAHAVANQPSEPEIIFEQVCA